MLSIGWPELFLISVVTVIVVGPKELPRVLKAVRAFMRKGRELAGEFQAGIDTMIRESELDDVRRQVDRVRRFDLEREVKNQIDPGGEMDKALAEDARALTHGPSTPAVAKPDAAKLDAGEAPAPTEPRPEPDKRSRAEGSETPPA